MISIYCNIQISLMNLYLEWSHKLYKRASLYCQCLVQSIGHLSIVTHMERFNATFCRKEFVME